MVYPKNIRIDGLLGIKMQIRFIDTDSEILHNEHANNEGKNDHYQEGSEFMGKDFTSKVLRHVTVL